VTRQVSSAAAARSARKAHITIENACKSEFQLADDGERREFFSLLSREANGWRSLPRIHCVMLK
jgi:hypothetical protein